MNITNYTNIIFDSDGVVFDSNAIKLTAFCNVGNLVSGQDSACLIKRHILANKGLSRHEILAFILELSPASKKDVNYNLSSLQSIFSELVLDQMRKCAVDPAIFFMRDLLHVSTWYVLTLGDELETQRLYRERNLDHLFNGGIFGSPRHKQENVDLIASVTPTIVTGRTLLIGDSVTDALLAQANGFDFVLLTHWSQCDKAIDFCERNSLMICSDLNELLQYI